MTRFRFHVFNDHHTVDEDGRDFSGLDEARTYAIGCIREIMADEIKTAGQINLKHRIEIEDEQGEMHVVAFSEAVTVHS